jgi:hypothetical protein
MNQSLNITLANTLEFIPLNKDEQLLLRSENEYKLMHDQLSDLHKSFQILNTIIEKQEEDIESIHERIEETTRNVKESEQELIKAEESKFTQRFTNASLGAMTGVLCAGILEIILPGSGIFGGAIIGGLSGFFHK